MGIQKKEVDYSKESDDVLVLLIGLVKDVKAGKSAAEIASGNLPELMEAIAGADQIVGEAKEHRVVVLQTVGYRTGELADALLPAVA